MRRSVWIPVFALIVWISGCTEPNPLYHPASDADGNTEEDGDTPVGPDADADADADADTDADADADVDADADADADADGDADADVPDAPPPDDVDGDGVLNTVDNCPDVWNPGQEDCDGDTVGDRCEGGDIDSDTIPDALDVCPCGPGASTHDEDGDGVFDDCDNCPLVANVTQANANLDGLGDACVPPSAPDLHLGIDRFEPFLALPADPGWLEVSGTWALGTDTYDETDTAASSIAFYDPWDRGNDTFMQSVFRITALGTGSGAISKQVGVLARAISLTDGSNRWYSCGLDGAHDRVEIRSWNGTAYATLAQQDVGISLTTGTDYRISFLVRGASLACSFEPAGVPAVTAFATSSALPIGAPGLRTYRASASFSGLMVAR